MRVSAVLVALALAALMIPGAAAQTVVLGRWAGTLYLPRVGQCDGYDSCPALEDVSYVDIDVSEAMARAPPHSAMGYNNVDTGTALRSLTGWRVCLYDAHGARLECKGETDGILVGAVPSETAFVRVILTANLDRPFVFTLTATT